jgi:hypothetical protein
MELPAYLSLSLEFRPIPNAGAYTDFRIALFSPKHGGRFDDCDHVLLHIPWGGNPDDPSDCRCDTIQGAIATHITRSENVIGYQPGQTYRLELRVDDGLLSVAVDGRHQLTQGLKAPRISSLASSGRYWGFSSWNSHVIVKELDIQPAGAPRASAAAPPAEAPRRATFDDWAASVGPWEISGETLESPQPRGPNPGAKYIWAPLGLGLPRRLSLSVEFRAIRNAEAYCDFRIVLFSPRHGGKFDDCNHVLLHIPWGGAWDDPSDSRCDFVSGAIARHLTRSQNVLEYGAGKPYRVDVSIDSQLLSVSVDGQRQITQGFGRSDLSDLASAGPYWGFSSWNSHLVVTELDIWP